MKYLTPELEIVKFLAEDVLGASELAEDTNENWQAGNKENDKVDPLQF